MTPEPELYERFLIRYSTGTVIESHYPGGASLQEAQVAHPLATVEAVQDSQIAEE